MKRVTAGHTYIYDPVPLDVYDARTALKPGDTVTVVNLRGCPPANTMNMCHVNDANGEFAGLVCVGSLTRLVRR
jgi:hypothetical protein